MNTLANAHECDMNGGGGGSGARRRHRLPDAGDARVPGHIRSRAAAATGMVGKPRRRRAGGR